MFVVLVAAELYGAKHNMELGFPARPALAEFLGHCEATFRCEALRVRPAKALAPSFTIELAKVFDDTLNRWVDLVSDLQIVEWGQYYLFQPAVPVQNIYAGASTLGAAVADDQDILDAPIRIRSPLETGTGKEQIFFLFHDMDFNGNGLLSREEVQRVFNVMGIFSYSERQIDAFFDQFDTNRDGVLSFAEFTRWMQTVPVVQNALLRASIAYWDSARNRRPDFRDSSQLTDLERHGLVALLDQSRRRHLLHRAAAGQPVVVPGSPNRSRMTSGNSSRPSADARSFGHAPAAAAVSAVAAPPTASTSRGARPGAINTSARGFSASAASGASPTPGSPYYPASPTVPVDRPSAPGSVDARHALSAGVGAAVASPPPPPAVRLSGSSPQRAALDGSGMPAAAPSLPHPHPHPQQQWAGPVSALGTPFGAPLPVANTAAHGSSRSAGDPG